MSASFRVGSIGFGMYQPRVRIRHDRPAGDEEGSRTLDDGPWCVGWVPVERMAAQCSGSLVTVCIGMIGRIATSLSDWVVRVVQRTVALMAGRVAAAGNRFSRLFLDGILWDDNRIIKPVSHRASINNDFL